MDSIKVKARGKINLTLDIIGRREDGYHYVDMVMQAISLADVLELKLTDGGIEISCNKPYVPTDQRNIVYKACTLLKDRYSIPYGVEVDIQKNIPVAAGLAGGSADAAATLIGLNQLWKLNLSLEDLMDLGGYLGADVPFCIRGGTALAGGIGEKLTPLDPLPRYYLVLVKPGISISTPWAYSLIDLDRIEARPDNRQMVAAIKNKDISKIPTLLANVFEPFVFDVYPELGLIKIEILELGAMGALMSGSGPTVYGLFDDRDLAENACRELSNRPYRVILSETYNAGR